MRLLLYTSAFIVSVICSGSLIGYSSANQNASLSIVFDVSGSMEDDLKQVRNGFASLFRNEVTKSRITTIIKDFKIVPVHDTQVGPVQSTRSPEVFRKDIAKLYPQGGGDCPENILTGIKKALKESRPNSFIYVFTDASAKDYKDLDLVYELIQKKMSQVTFVLTGMCNGTEDPGYKVYQAIATMSNGQVYNIKKDQIGEFMETFARTLVGGRVQVLSENSEEAAVNKTYTFPVDSSIKTITIQVTNPNDKEKINVVIRDPKGRRITEAKGLNGLQRLMQNVSSVFFGSIDQPITGKWILEVTTKSKSHSVRISGSTGGRNVDFIQGFTTLALVPTWAKTSLRPLKGRSNYMKVNINGGVSAIQYVSILQVNGKSIYRFKSGLSKDVNIYLKSYPLSLPDDQQFFIKVVGKDKKGLDFQRYSKIAITPRDVRKPTVRCPPKIEVKGGQNDTEIRCFINSEIPFVVEWSGDGGPDKNYLRPSNVTREIDNATEGVQGVYSVLIKPAEKYIKFSEENLKDETSYPNNVSKCQQDLLKRNINLSILQRKLLLAKHKKEMDILGIQEKYWLKKLNSIDKKSEKDK